MVTKPRKSLRLNTPDFTLSLTELDVDRDLMPALKLAVACTIYHSTGTFSYHADDIWVDFESLENFIGELGRLPNKMQDYASLASVERAVRLEITRQPENFKVRLGFSEHHPDRDDVTLSASFVFDDLNLLTTWYRGFSEFRR